MGHYHCLNISKFIIQHLCLRGNRYLKGKVSLMEMALFCKKKIDSAKNESDKREAISNYGVIASEGGYSDIGTLLNGIELLLSYHYNNKIIIPILNNKKQKDIFKVWSKDGIIFLADKETKIMESLKWKLNKGAIKKYRNNQIDHIREIEL